MILGRFLKQPAETLDYDIDFTEFLSDGDLLVTTGDPPVPSPLDVTVVPTGMTLGPTVVLDGKKVKQWLSGGIDGVSYKITLTLTSNAGRVKQVEFVVRVKDE
jgi:hypothetical protein